MTLHNKIAVIYGAGGSLGSAVAKSLAGAGARLFLTGRTLHNVQKVADEINAFGATAEAAQVDATDEKQVNDHLAAVVQKAGAIDISFTAIDLQVVQNIPLVEIAVHDFVR